MEGACLAVFAYCLFLLWGLLPGHGSRPADLMLPDFDDWENIVAHHADLLSAEVEEHWLGGFSTGGNLVMSQALTDEDEGSYLMLENGQDDLVPPDSPDTLWFGAWGRSEAEKYHARLIWNPYFDELLENIRKVTAWSAEKECCKSALVVGE